MENTSSNEETKTINLGSTALYQRLSKPIPKELLIKYEVEDGKELTTYPAQYAIDLLNKEIGYSGYHIITRILDKMIIGKSWLVAVEVTINLTNDSLTPVSTSYVEGFGSEYANDLDTALKSAKTKAFKHACRFLGIGKELYYDTVIEEVPTKVAVQIEETPSEVTDIITKISNTKTLIELEPILAEIDKIKNEKMQIILTRNYNKAKIKLEEDK